MRFRATWCALSFKAKMIPPWHMLSPSCERSIKATKLFGSGNLDVNIPEVFASRLILRGAFKR